MIESLKYIIVSAFLTSCSAQNVIAFDSNPKRITLTKNSHFIENLLFINNEMSKSQLNSFSGGDDKWDELRDFCTENHGRVSSWEYQGEQYFRYAVNFALCYRVAKYQGNLTDANEYAADALRILNNYLLSFIKYSTDSGYGIRNYVPALAITYSWLRDYEPFTEKNKMSVRIRMKQWLDWYAGYGYSRNEPIANYHTGYVLASVLMSLAISKDDPEGQQRLNKAIALFNDGKKIFDLNMPGGHWPEGWSYGAGVYERYAMASAALFKSTGNMEYQQFQWLSSNIDLKLGALSPDGLFFYDDGLWSRNRHGVAVADDMYAVGFLYGWDSVKGKKIQRYIRNIAKLPSVSEWKKFLFYDKNSQATADVNIANSYHAIGTGLITMREKRSDPYATWGSFITGPYLSYEREQDMDQGHIMLYKTAPLLIDAGHGLYSDDHLNASKHHNTYTLANRSDVKFDGQRNFPITSGCANDAIGIDYYFDNGKSVFSRGEFSNAYKPQPHWTGKCYSPGIGSLTRSVFYLRPNLFFIYDQIKKIANQPLVVPHMHLHFPTKPIAFDNNRKLTINNDTGRLQVITIFPKKSINSLDENSASGSLINGWHLDVSAKDSSLMYYRYLHVLRAGLNESDYNMPETSSINGIDIYGVHITKLNSNELSSGSANILFADNKTNIPPSIMTYTLHNNTVANNSYILNLKPNTTYGVTIAVNHTTIVRIKEGDGDYLSDQSGMIEINN